MTKTVPRPGSLVWATLRGWQLHYQVREGGRLVCEAWHIVSGRKTGWHADDADGRSAALRAAAAMDEMRGTEEATDGHD